jgi:ATP-dependent exoDNAse (exonuclease V) alpha subunit
MEKNESKSINLTQDQKRVLKQIQLFIIKKEKYFRLTGYAGTGKSFLMSQLVELLKQNNDYHFCLAGPTHKSVKTIKNLITGNIDIQTLARLLGKRPAINYEEGKEVFSQYREVDLSRLDLLIVDEFSMINKDDFRDLLNAAYQNHFKIIFVGDAAQLPPVGEKEPIVATYPEITHHAELTKIVRYDGAIAKVAEEIRSNNQYKQQIYQFKTSEDQSIIVLPQKAWLETAIQHFAAGWSINPDLARIICWRNKTVADFNQRIRKARHGNHVPLYIPGDLLICRKPLFRKPPNVEDWKQYADNRSEFLVMKEPQLIEIENLIQYYLIVAQGEDNEEYFLKVLTPESAQQFEREQQQLKKKAIEAKNAGKKYNHFWFQFYDRLKWYDDIAHAMSITTHSAQGSSVDTVFLYAHEMRWCEEKQQILYTALTRARKKVYVCQSF